MQILEQLVYQVVLVAAVVIMELAVLAHLVKEMLVVLVELTQVEEEVGLVQ